MKHRVKISEELVQHFLKWSSGYLTNPQMDELICSFENEFSKYYHSRSEESNLIRIMYSVIDKGTFLLDCFRYPHHVEILCAIASSSNYLADILVRNPELLYQLFSESYLNADLREKTISNEIENGFRIFKKHATKIKFLKSLKRKYILKIGINDILGKLDTLSVTKQISLLAYTINSYLFNLSYKMILDLHQIKTTKRKFCLMALGKLGGNELNYSSDIDLMVIYDKDSLVGSRKNIYYSDILTETINQFITWATEFSDLGNLYRVDFRLRPDGHTSALSRSLLDTINYYESRGEQWEKQMLIKLNRVCGDIDLFNQFQSFVHSYVYKTSSFQSPLEAIAKMKINIERQYSNKLNVKTTIGGIRDIEFAIQGLQLIHGRKITALRIGNSLECLQVLHENNLLDESEYKNLSEAYVLYRRIEHYLQLMNNTQTHSLPEDQKQLKQITRYFGFDKTITFEQNLANRQKMVRKIFNSIISPSGKMDIVQNIFEQVQFDDPQRAKKNLEFLEFGTGLITKKSFDAKTTDRYNVLKPDLAEYLIKSNFPDLIIENFAKIVSGYKLPSILYNGLMDKKLFHQFLRILEFSEFSLNLLLEHPPFVENVLSKKLFYKDFKSFIYASNFKELLFILSCQYTLGLIDESKASEWICAFIEFKIQSTYEKLNLSGKHFIAGLGSFALHDVNFRSDIDLIVVAEDVGTQTGLDEIFQNFLSELQKELFPIEIDFRLRPEGKSSPLVWDIKNYEKYLNERAGIWEFQSLIKANYICGDKNIFNQFTSVVYKTLNIKSREEVRNSIREMHKKSTQLKFSSFGSAIDIKNSNGSFITLDYLLTMHLLNSMNKKTMFVGGQKKINLIKSLFKNDSVIFENYKFLKKVLFTLQIVANWNKAKLPTDPLILQRTCIFIGDISHNELKTKLLAIFAKNQKLFQQTLDNLV